MDGRILIFRDPLFTEERDRSAAIAEGIIRKHLPVQFECETRLDDLDADLLNLLTQAGLHTITFGVESVDPQTLKRVARRPIPPAHQKAIVGHCRELGVQTQGFYVFGFPYETAESIRATINYAIELGSTTAMFKVLTPYPGTPWYKQIASRIFETDLEKFDGYTLTFNHPNLAADQMRFLLGSAYARFYVRPSWAWNYLGFRGFRRGFERMDDYTRRKQLANEMAFFGSQSSDGRIRVIRTIPRYGVRHVPGSTDAALEALRCGRGVQGPEIAVFERRFAEYCGVPHAVSASYGRMAFYYILKAFDFPAGSEIIFPALTFWIVPEIARVCGLKPVFVDIDDVRSTSTPHGYSLRSPRRPLQSFPRISTGCRATWIPSWPSHANIA